MGGPRGESPEANKEVMRKLKEYLIDKPSLLNPSSSSSSSDRTADTVSYFDKDALSHFVLRLVMCRTLECRLVFASVCLF